MRLVRWETVLVCTTLLLIGASGVQRTRIVELQTALEGATPDLLRMRTLDRLGGRSVDTALEKIRVRRDEQRVTLLWLLDPEWCLGCLADVRDWNRLARNDGLNPLLILNGVDNAEARAIAREAGIEGSVKGDSASLVPAQLGLATPSTMLLISPLGEVLLVDARYPAQACNWSLQRTLSQLLGGTNWT